MDIKPEIIQALSNSLLPHNHQIRQATHFLTELRHRPSYSLALMEITDDHTLPLPIRQASLIQLKNTIRNKWNNPNNQLPPQQKTLIQNTLLTALIRSSHQHKLLKLYKEILTIIINEDYKQWTPLNEIIAKLRHQEDIEPIMHSLISISTAFEFTINHEQRTYLFQFIQLILPELSALLQQTPTSSFIYLLTKFLWKSIHYDINNSTKQLLMNWFPLITSIISTTNPQYHHHPLQHQQHNTQQFFYFHTKKWALRIVQRCIYKHMKFIKCKKPTPEQAKSNQLSQLWFNTYGTPIIDLIYHQLTLDTTPKIQYFQFKCFHSLLLDQPHLLKPYASNLQYEILLPYLQLKSQDQQLATSQPLQFLIRQQQGLITYKNLKKIATDLWIGISQISHKLGLKNIPYKSGIYFENNLHYLKTKLQSPNPLEKEMSMYLLCKMRSLILKNHLPALPHLLSYYILPEFTSQLMLMRARTVEIFYQYGMIDFPPQTLTAITQHLYQSLTADQYPIVRIKAAIALRTILKHQPSKELLKPKLKQILTVYLQLLDAYDLQLLVSSLETIVSQFSLEIGPYAYDLSKCLIKIFTKLFHRDIEDSKKQQYMGEMELAAAGCLKAITQIIDSPITKQVLSQLQPTIINLFHFCFHQSALDYFEDLLILFNSYLFKLDLISQQLWFFYEILIYHIVGIPHQLWNSIQQLPLSDDQKKTLMEVKQGGNLEIMEQTMPVLRNYISKGSTTILHGTDSFNRQLFDLLFLLIDQIYHKNPSEYEGELQQTCCTALIIYFLENNQTLPQPIITKFWHLAKYNILHMHTKTLLSLNIQLIAMLFFVGRDQFFNLLTTESMLDPVILQLLSNQYKITDEHQKQRLILGLSELITLPTPQFPLIFQYLLQLVKENIEERFCLCYDDYQSDYNVDDDDNDIDDFDDNNDEEEDLHQLLDTQEDSFWQQQYSDNYCSILDEIDELKHFSNAIHQIQTNHPNLYSQILLIIPTHQLKLLLDKIAKAVSLYDCTN